MHLSKFEQVGLSTHELYAQLQKIGIFLLLLACLTSPHIWHIRRNKRQNRENKKIAAFISIALKNT
jgi:hypothetical protein